MCLPAFFYLLQKGHQGVCITSGLEPGRIFSYSFIYSLDGPQCVSR